MTDKETTVDARGLSCPEPVLMTLEALRSRAGKAISVRVSSATARDNVRRTLEDAGLVATVSEDGDDWLVRAGTS